METSILKSTKKVLQIADDDESFDLDVTTHINSALSILHDLGIGPSAGFFVEDSTKKWEDFLPPPQPMTDTYLSILSKVKTAVFLRVRLLFDPPASSYLLSATKDQLSEIEWRLSVNREALDWSDPMPPVTESADL